MKASLLSSLLFLILAGIAAIWGGPFSYDRANSGRYLLVVANRMDPELFPGDQVVQSLSRFDSLFYRFLPRLLSVPERFEHDLFWIYALLKLGFICSLFCLARTITDHPLVPAVLLSWCALTSASLLGGIPFVGDVATHSEPAVVLGIMALVCAFRRHYWGFWLLIGFALFIHSLVTVHLLACVVPALLLREQLRNRNLLIGAGAFAFIFLAYLHWMTPPHFTAEQARVFVSAKGDMIHISPFAQGTEACVRFGLMLALAFIARRRLLPESVHARSLVAFAIWGTVVALTLASTAVLTHSLSLMQVQPMRIFLWVTLFVYVIIAWAAAVALSQRLAAGWALSGVVIFSIASPLWVYPLAALAVPLLLMTGMGGQRDSVALKRWALLLGCATGILVIGFAFSGNHSPLKSMRNPWLALLGIGLALLSLSSIQTSKLYMRFVLVVCALAVVIGSTQRWASAAQKRQRDSVQDWLSVCTWCREHSRKNDRFLVPPSGDNFRLHALRTCLGEAMSALAWVDVACYETNVMETGLVRSEQKNGVWDLNGLRKLAGQDGARFLVIAGAFQPPEIPRFVSGQFSVHAVAP